MGVAGSPSERCSFLHIHIELGEFYRIAADQADQNVIGMRRDRLIVMETSTAAIIEQPNELTLQEFPIPDIDTDEAILDVDMVGVCASDPGIYKGYTDFPLPLIPGHEIVGRIHTIGDEAKKDYGVEVGDRVVVFPGITCGSCLQCQLDRSPYCENRNAYGMRTSSTEPPHLWGGYSEYMYIAPGSTLFPLPDSVADEAGVLVSAVLGNSIRWTQLGDTKLTNYPILIQGPGPQGLGATIAADAAGASHIIVTGLDQDRDRLAFAELCGADTTINISQLDESLEKEVRNVLDGELPRKVLDVTGNKTGIKNSLNAVAKGGDVTLAGIIKGDPKLMMNFNDLITSDISIQTPLSHNVSDAYEAVQLVSNRGNQYPFEKFISSTMDLKDAERALKITANDIDDVEQPIRIALTP